MYRCLVCRTRVSLGAYKKLLFSFSDKEENIPLDTLIKNKKNDKDVWTMSLNEFLLIRELFLVYTIHLGYLMVFHNFFDNILCSIIGTWTS